jgi:hypothetical protein
MAVSGRDRKKQRRGQARRSGRVLAVMSIKCFVARTVHARRDIAGDGTDGGVAPRISSPYSLVRPRAGFLGLALIVSIATIPQDSTTSSPVEVKTAAQRFGAFAPSSLRQSVRQSGSGLALRVG